VTSDDHDQILKALMLIVGFLSGAGEEQLARALLSKFDQLEFELALDDDDQDGHEEDG